MSKISFYSYFEYIIVLKLARGSKERKHFLIGHPNKKFRFPSTQKVGSVGRVKNQNQKIISK